MEIEDPAGPGCRDSPGAAQAAEGQQKRENKEKGTKKMKKMNNKRGFTLAELLIVVAIIAVLVAISIPVFTSQLERAREATDLSNIRSAYAEILVLAVTDDTTAAPKSSSGATLSYSAGVYTAVVKMNQKQNDWEGDNATATVGTVAASSFKRTDTLKTQYKITYTVDTKAVAIVAE